MAKSANVLGFEYKRHLSPNVQTPSTLEVILANSIGPLTVGDAVQYTSGFLTGADAGEVVLGILIGFVTVNGENLFKARVSVGGTKAGDDTYTAAADNQTVDQVKGVVIVDQMALFLAKNSNTALTQAKVGLFFDGLASSGTTVDEVTGAGATFGTTDQFQLIEIVPVLEDGTTSTAYGLFKIGESQLAQATS